LGLRRRLWRAIGFALGAGIIGLAGFWLLQGRDFRVIRSFSAGLGWSGLACAIVARSNPLFIPFASLLFAWLERGAEGAEIAAGLPHELSGVIEACVFLAVASDIAFFQARRGKKA
jgi:simple sugar transport system permease protein